MAKTDDEVTMIGYDAQDEKPIKQKTLESFFNVPAKQSVTQCTTKTKNITEYFKSTIGKLKPTQKTNGLASPCKAKLFDNSSEDFEEDQSFRSEIACKQNSTKADRDRKYIKSDKNEKLIKTYNKSKKTKVKLKSDIDDINIQKPAEEPLIDNDTREDVEEISYADFINQNLPSDRNSEQDLVDTEAYGSDTDGNNATSKSGIDNTTAVDIDENSNDTVNKSQKNACHEIFKAEHKSQAPNFTPSNNRPKDCSDHASSSDEEEMVPETVDSSTDTESEQIPKCKRKAPRKRVILSDDEDDDVNHQTTGISNCQRIEESPHLDKKVIEKDRDVDEVDVLPSQPPKGCVAITSFFAAGPKKPIPVRKKKEEDHSEVVVIAEIHPEPTPPKSQEKSKIFTIFSKEKPQPKEKERKHVNQKRKKKTMLSPKNNAVACEGDIDLSITHIETTYITLEEKKTTKRRLLADDEETAEKENGQTEELALIISDDPHDNEDKKHLLEQKKDIDEKTEAQEEAERILEEEMKVARQAVLTAQFAAMDSIQVKEVKKTAQATLNFGGKGMVLQKPVPKSPKKSNQVKSQTTRIRKKNNTDKDVETELTDSDEENIGCKTPKSKKRSKKSDTPSNKSKQKSSESESNKASRPRGRPRGTKKDKTEASQENVTPPKRTHSKSGKRADESLELDESGEPMTPRKKRVLRSVYKTTLMHPRRGKKQTPLKLKITRLGESSQDDEAFSPNSRAKKEINRSKAQKLLQKAKAGGASTKPKGSPVASLKLKQAKSAKPTGSSGSKKNKRAAQQATSEDACRRSSRNSSLNARQAISICYEEHKVHPKKGVENQVIEISNGDVKEKKTPRKLPKSPKKTPAKTPRKTPLKKKKGVSLAAIFQKTSKKNVIKPGDSPIALSDSSEEEVELTEEEKEAQRVKRVFLLSGVPQALKKQIAIQEAVVIGEYAPVPKISHVLQASPLDCEEASRLSNINPWALSTGTLNKQLYRPDDWWQCGQLNPKVTLQLGQLTGCKTDCISYQKAESVTEVPIKEDVMKLLLAEIATENLSFPIRKMYRQLVARKREPETQKDETVISTEGPKEELKSTKTTFDISNVKKRKMSDVPENETRRRSKRRRASVDDVIIVENSEPPVDSEKSSSRLSLKKNPTDDDCCLNKVSGSTGQDKSEEVAGQDRLWTDKYSPASSTEILGNSNTVRKLKTWLVEWKHKTDVEMRKLRKEQLKQAKKDGKSKEEIKKKLGDDWWTSDESDFDLSNTEDSSDDEDEDYMCNTTLLTGPHGVGKTATVYALAQELGYKVFEVNSSSRRSGKHILAQLQEATQSHQVSKANIDAMYTSLMTGRSANPIDNKPKPEKKLPTAFTNLLKKSDTTTKSDTGDAKAKTTENKLGSPQKKGKRGRPKKETTVEDAPPAKKPKRKSREGRHPKDASQIKDGGHAAKPRKGLNLSSVSLILFDEVDVVFEEDKGFWTAIQTFMSTTKRPIICTTTDPRFLVKFKGHMEHHILRKTSEMNITSYLQLLCLSENIRTNFADIRAVVSLYQSDLRKLILALQQWVQTGASVTPQTVPIRYRKKCLKERNITNKDNDFKGSLTPSKTTNNNPFLHQNDSQSGDDFEIIRKPRKLTKRLIIEDDESSRDSVKFSSPVKKPKSIIPLPFLDDEGSSQGFPELSGASQDGSQDQETPDNQMIEVPLTSTTPSVHLMACPSIIGVTNWVHVSTSGQTLVQVLQDSKHSNDIQHEISTRFLSQRINILYCNLPFMIGLPTVQSAPNIPISFLPSVPTCIGDRVTRRILNTHDLYDSEASNDGFLTLSQSSKFSDTVTESQKSSKDSGIHETIFKENSHAQKQSRTKIESSRSSRLVCDSLTNLANLYDCMSTCDSYFTVPDQDVEGSCSQNDSDWCSGTILPGLTDAQITINQSCSSNTLPRDVTSCLSVGAFNRTKSSNQKIKSSIETLDEEGASLMQESLSIPVENTQQRLRLTSEDTLATSIGQSVQRTAGHVSNFLPLSVSQQKAALATDYIPTVRNICKLEQLRLALNKKRRFFHYLDSMVHQMKKSTLDTLCTTFQ